MRYSILVAILFVSALHTGCTPTPTPKPTPMSTPIPASSASAVTSQALPPKPADTIRIGMIVPLSGAGADAGQPMVNGLKLYLDEVHNRMAGKKIDLVVESDGSNPATGVEMVRKLVEKDNADLLCGIYFSHILYAIAPVVDAYKIPFVDVVSGADDVTQRKRAAWVVRTSWSSSQPSHPMGDYAYKKLGYRKVITFASDYPYGYEVVGGFQQTFEQAGGQVVQKLWAPLGLTHFEDTIKSMRKDADAVFMCFAGQSSEIIPKQYQDVGPKLPIIGATTSFDESFYPRLGDELVGAISANPYSTALNTPANKRFVEAYRAKYNTDPSWYSECGYTAGMWMDRSLQAVKGDVTDRPALLSALQKTTLADAPRGPLKLDAYANPVDNIYIRKVERVNGKLQNTVIFTYPMVSQFWTYNPQEYLKQPAYTRDYPPCTHCDQAP